jgi:hypothetical protein
VVVVARLAPARKDRQTAGVVSMEQRKRRVRPTKGDAAPVTTRVGRCDKLLLGRTTADIRKGRAPVKAAVVLSAAPRQPTCFCLPSWGSVATANCEPEKSL